MITDPVKTCRGMPSGFTLPEATMALVLLGIAAAGVLLPFGSGAAVQAEGWRKTLAAKLANDLVEKTASKRFDDTIALGDGYTRTEAEGQVEDAAGSRFTDPMYAGFSRDVTYLYAYPWPGVYKPVPDYVLVRVQVSYRGALVADLSRLISR